MAAGLTPGAVVLRDFFIFSLDYYTNV